MTLHVQTDSLSRIEGYAQNPAEVEFVLLGYWIEGSYVERFSTLSGNSDASWADEEKTTLRPHEPEPTSTVVLPNQVS